MREHTVYTPGSENNMINEKNQLLERSNFIARETGVGAKTVVKILQTIIRESNNLFTSQSLADALSISRRSADRIIEKLESAGYAATIGKMACGEKGRPSRVVELFLEH